MSWLQNVGKGIVIGLGYIAKFEGLIPASASTNPTIRKIESELSQAAEVIVAVEAMGQALSISGPDKLKAAAPQVAQIILKSDMMIGHQIENQTLFNEGSSDIANGLAKILNSLKAK